MKHFKNHKAGDTTSKWYELEKESQKFCKVEQVKKTHSIVFDGGMPLEHDADSVVLEPSGRNPARKGPAGEGPAGENPGDESSEDESSEDED